MKSRGIKVYFTSCMILNLVLTGISYAQQFMFINKTDGTVKLDGVIPQTISFKPAGQGSPTVSQSSASWQAMPGMIVSPSIHRLDPGSKVTITLPDTNVTQKLPYGSVIYDFSQAPTYTITTSKVTGYQTKQVVSPVYTSKSGGRTIKVPVYATTTFTPENGQVYAISLQDSEVLVNQLYQVGS